MSKTFNGYKAFKTLLNLLVGQSYGYANRYHYSSENLEKQLYQLHVSAITHANIV